MCSYLVVGKNRYNWWIPLFMLKPLRKWFWQFEISNLLRCMWPLNISEHLWKSSHLNRGKTLNDRAFSQRQCIYRPSRTFPWGMIKSSIYYTHCNSGWKWSGWWRGWWSLIHWQCKWSQIIRINQAMDNFSPRIIFQVEGIGSGTDFYFWSICYMSTYKCKRHCREICLKARRTKSKEKVNWILWKYFSRFQYQILPHFSRLCSSL